MKNLIVILLFAGALQTAMAQDEQEWKPRTHITGYVNTIAEYTNLDDGFRDPKPLGIGLSEAAFLVSYKPLEKLEFKRILSEHLTQYQ